MDLPSSASPATRFACSAAMKPRSPDHVRSCLHPSPGREVLPAAPALACGRRMARSVVDEEARRPVVPGSNGGIHPGDTSLAWLELFGSAGAGRLGGIRAGRFFVVPGDAPLSFSGTTRPRRVRDVPCVRSCNAGRITPRWTGTELAYRAGGARHGNARSSLFGRMQSSPHGCGKRSSVRLAGTEHTAVLTRLTSPPVRLLARP